VRPGRGGEAEGVDLEEKIERFVDRQFEVVDRLARIEADVGAIKQALECDSGRRGGGSPSVVPYLVEALKVVCAALAAVVAVKVL